MENVEILENQDDPQAIPYFGQPEGVYTPNTDEDDMERARR